MNRIFHTWDRWECYPAGFYENGSGDLTTEQAEEKYRAFLAGHEFQAALDRVISEWKHSCEHYLSNEKMNRIAWLGQASACIALGLPSCFRGGYNMLSDVEKSNADILALAALNKWLAQRGEAPLTPEEAQSKTEANIY